MLKSFKTIDNPNRIISIDILRGIAILSVVLYHYDNFLPYGHLGVDLFFVISGLLVGGILVRKFKRGETINYLKFIFQRGFKIWPSYYFFIGIGSLISYILYRNSHSNLLFESKELPKYLFFYNNYTGNPKTTFYHVWSICVEEHFYLLIPLLFITLSFLLKRKNEILLMLTGSVILLGITMKYISLFHTNSQDTYAGTHNRVDALAWGVMLAILFELFNVKIKNKLLFIFSGLALFIFSIYFHLHTSSLIYQKVIFHSIIPFSFFIFILGVYTMDFKGVKSLRLIAYYSYNWYLWHPIFLIFFEEKFGTGLFGLSLFLIVSFSVAVITTIFIEEFFLSKRTKVIKLIFK